MCECSKVLKEIVQRLFNMFMPDGKIANSKRHNTQLSYQTSNDGRKAEMTSRSTWPESVAWPVHMDVDPSTFLSLPDTCFVRVDGVWHVISVIKQLALIVSISVISSSGLTTRKRWSNELITNNVYQPWKTLS